MRQLEKCAEPAFLGFTKQLDVFPAICAAYRCADGNHENVDQQMPTIVGSGIVQFGKMLHQGSIRGLIHGPPFYGRHLSP